jgi:hypothetical protein
MSDQLEEPPPVVLRPVRRAGSHWRARVARSAGLAVIATLVLAVGAAALLEAVRREGPRDTGGTSAASPTLIPEQTARPGPASPAASNLPDRFLGAGPQPTDRLLVRRNRLELLDLASGRSVPLGGRSWNDQVVRLDGRYACVCREELDDGRAAIALVRFDERGERLRSDRLLAAEGEAPPSWEPLDYMSWTATVSADEQLLFLGTIIRQPPVWHVALHTVDLVTGRVRDSVELAELPTDLPEGRPDPTPVPGTPASFDGVYAFGPFLAAAPDGASLIVTSTASTQRGDAQTSTRQAWIVALGPDGVIQRASEHVSGSGLLDPACWDPPFFVATGLPAAYCVPVSGKPFVRRVATDGSVLGDIVVDGLPAVPGLPIIDRPGGLLYAWDPFSHTLVRIDPRGAGTVTVNRIDPEKFAASTTTGASGRAITDLAGSIGAWIAPAALAKIWLDPSLALSPDGRRLYAIGVDAGAHEIGGSTGVWVFDAATLALVDHLAPTADYVSIMVSDDGRFLYAAGLPDRDASGRQASWPASLTAVDVATGEPALILGDLGSNMLMFVGPAAR